MRHRRSSRPAPNARRRLAKGPKSRLFIHLQRLWTLFAESYEEGMADTQYSDQRVTSGQVFGHIEDGGLTVTELARRAGMSKQSMAELVDKLLASGYLRCAPDPHDRRAKLIMTTDKGERQIETSRAVVRTIEAGWARTLGKKRFQQLKTMLQELATISDTEPASKLR